MEQNQIICFLVLTLGCLFVASTVAVEHVVGGSSGWTIPPNATFYEEWAKSKIFAVGDKIVFRYEEDKNNVIEVPKQDYEMCRLSNPEAVHVHFSSPTIITLNNSVTKYFYCGIPTNCDKGQKLALKFSGDENGYKKITPAPGPKKSDGSKRITPTPGPNKSDGSAHGAGRIGIFASFLLVAFISLW